jgi:hypothetical protein
VANVTVQPPTGKGIWSKLLAAMAHSRWRRAEIELRKFRDSHEDSCIE